MAAQYLTTREVSLQVPARASGRPITPATVDRWIKVGIQLPRSRKRLRLKGKRIGNRWCVSPEALEEFIDALTAAWEGG